MKVWYNCKVKYQIEENGKVKNVVDHYMVDAMSYTEAEARIHEELGSIIRGDFQITSLTKSNIMDLFHYEDSDFWHKCKIVYELDSESGQAKKITNYMLVTAKDVEEAYKRIYESLKDMLVTFKVPEVVETQIVEIFPYIGEENTR